MNEMFYLMTHSTHFIYGYMASDIWLRTILIERKETCCHHIGYSHRLTARVFYMHHPTDRITHTTAFVTPVVEHLLEQEISQNKSNQYLNQFPTTGISKVMVCAFLSVEQCCIKGILLHMGKSMLRCSL